MHLMGETEADRDSRPLECASVWQFARTSGCYSLQGRNPAFIGTTVIADYKKVHTLGV